MRSLKKDPSAPLPAADWQTEAVKRTREENPDFLDSKPSEPVSP